MRQILAMERRIQDLERAQQNKIRYGKVTEVKFDKQKKRWFAKMEQGSGNDVFKSDWLPWKTFANGSISFSIPPRVGQSVSLQAPNGQPEMGYLEAFHNNPENPSPHDKEDEVFVRVKMPGQDDPDQTIDLHFTKDGGTIKIGKTTFNLTKDTVKTDTENSDTTTKKHSVNTEERVVSANKTTIESTNYKLTGKVLINS